MKHLGRGDRVAKAALAVVVAVLTVSLPTVFPTVPFCCPGGRLGCNLPPPPRGAGESHAAHRLEGPTPECCRLVLPGDRQTRAETSGPGWHGPGPALRPLGRAGVATLEPLERLTPSTRPASPDPPYRERSGRAPPLA